MKTFNDALDTYGVPKPCLIEETTNGVRISFAGKEFAEFAAQNPEAVLEIPYKGRSYSIMVPFYLEQMRGSR